MRFSAGVPDTVPSLAGRSARLATAAVAGLLLALPAQPVAADPNYVWSEGNLTAKPKPAPNPTRKKYKPRVYPALMQGGARPKIAPEAPEIITFPNKETKGTVIIVNSRCRLYYTISPTQAYEYPISIGRLGFTWTGTERISRVVDWPSWSPPPQMLKRQPGLPRHMTGGVRNPMGARALYLGNTLYRIHGTNSDRTIGQSASSGCFRMLNEHVMHLSSLTRIGTKVKVMEKLPPGVGVSAWGVPPVCGAEVPILVQRREAKSGVSDRIDWRQGAFISAE